MNRRKQQFTSIFLIVCLTLQVFIAPVLSQTESAVKALFERYRSTYVEYTSAVSQNASPEVIQQKYNDYRLAYSEYDNAVKGYQNSGNTISSTATETVAVTSTELATQTAVYVNTYTWSTTGTSTAVEVSSTATFTSTDTSTKNGPFGWFKSVFNKIKDSIIGTNDPLQVPPWEKILWTVGKAIIPTFGVMFATAFLAPLSPIAMIAGGIVTGAALGGMMTYAYEKRMNAKYRETPKEDAKIWRDVTVQATVEAVMAPFNLATGCLFGMVGPTMGSAIYKVAATQAAISFAGAGLSSVAGGVVKHTWATAYFKYPEKIKANEARINEIMNKHILANTQLSEDETKEVDKLRNEIITMRGEGYSHQDFLKDMKRSAVSAIISGFAGTVLSDKLYQPGSWADSLSIKVFGTAAQGKQISALLSTMPVNFLGGTSQALVEKNFIDKDIEELRARQASFPYGSAPHQYFEGAIKQLIEKRDSINYVQAGFDSLVNNLAVRSAQLSVQAVKYNIYDAPKVRKQTIEDAYRQNNEEWKKANELYEKYQEVAQESPSPLKIRNPLEFARAYAAHNQKVEVVRRTWLTQCINAQKADAKPENQALMSQITSKYDSELRMNQMLELGRLQGGQAHLNAMKEVLKSSKPELANLPDEDLSKLAAQAIQKTYFDKAESTSTKLKTMENTMNKYEEYKNGKLEMNMDEAKRLAAQNSMISPSQYKAALVEKQVYELKSNGVTWNEVNRRMPEILSSSERQTLNRYGNNWGNLLTAEVLANGMAKYKYDPDGYVNCSKEAKEAAKKIPQMVENGLVDDYRGRVNSAIVGAVIPANSGTQNTYERYMNSFARSALTASNDSVFNGMYQVSRDFLMTSFRRR
ncbi:MAG: hypothetical protein HQM10_02975 [Candidatus Riflebacteria bacterium]|nr:hypothetical protein [Candidatus Riflebacteria bacterium]